MSRIKTVVLNWVLGFLIGYVFATRSQGRGDALKSALISGSITAAIAWIVYDRYD